MLAPSLERIVRTGQYAVQPDDFFNRVGNMAGNWDASNTASLKVDSAGRVSLVGDLSPNSQQNGLILNGLSGNYASSPDSVSFPRGSFTVDVDLSSSNFAPSTTSALVAHDGSAGNRSMLLGLFVGSGQPVMRVILFTDGTNVATSGNSALIPALTPYSRATLRYIRDSVTGIISFMYSLDMGSTWNSAGTLNGVTGNLYDTTSSIEIGSAQNGTGSLFSGNFYRVRIWSDTTQTNLFFDSDFTKVAKLATSFTESSSNAATVTINSSGDTGARISGARDLVQLTASKQPIYLAWGGDNYAYLNGVSGNYLSALDSSALDITGDIDISSRIALQSYTPSATTYVLSKWASSTGNASYILRISTTGAINFVFSLNGSASVSVLSTANISASPYEIIWVRATRQYSSGDVNFYTSMDGNTWSQLGSTVSSASGSIFSGSSTVQIGALIDSAAYSIINVYRVIVKNGINGTVAFDFNPNNYNSGSTIIETSSNAATTTLNGVSVIVDRTQIYFDGVDDYMKAAQFSLSQPENIYFSGQQTAWTDARFIYDGNTDASMGMRQSSPSPQVNFYAGNFIGQLGGWNIKNTSVIYACFNSASSIARYNRTPSITGNIGSSQGGGFLVGARGSLASFSATSFSQIIIYDQIPHPSDWQESIAWQLGRKWKIAV